MSLTLKGKRSDGYREIHIHIHIHFHYAFFALALLYMPCMPRLKPCAALAIMLQYSAADMALRIATPQGLSWERVARATALPKLIDEALPSRLHPCASSSSLGAGIEAVAVVIIMIIIGYDIDGARHGRLVEVISPRPNPIVIAGHPDIHIPLHHLLVFSTLHSRLPRVARLIPLPTTRTHWALGQARGDCQQLLAADKHGAADSKAYCLSRTGCKLRSRDCGSRRYPIYRISSHSDPTKPERDCLDSVLHASVRAGYARWLLDFPSTGTTRHHLVGLLRQPQHRQKPSLRPAQPSQG